MEIPVVDYVIDDNDPLILKNKIIRLEVELARFKEQLVASERTSRFHAEHADDLCERLDALEKWGREVAVPGLQGAYKYMDHQTSGGLAAAQLLFKAIAQAHDLGLVEE